MARILIWDIETSDLRPDWGTTLCIGYKFLGDKKPTVISIMDFPGWEADVTDDSRLVKKFHEIMMTADMYVTFYGKDFDLKWMNSKFLEQGLPVLPPIAHVDNFYVAKTHLNLSRKSLDNLSKFLKLGKKKYYVEGAIWKRARVGDPVALGKVIQHCAADVNITEEAYLKLRPLVRQHPRVNGYANCEACGSDKLQRRGYALSTLKGKRQRVQCQNCGHWSLRPWEELLPKEKVVPGA